MARTEHGDPNAEKNFRENEVKSYTTYGESPDQANKRDLYDRETAQEQDIRELNKRGR